MIGILFCTIFVTVNILLHKPRQQTLVELAQVLQPTMGFFGSISHVVSSTVHHATSPGSWIKHTGGIFKPVTGPISSIGKGAYNAGRGVANEAGSQLSILKGVEQSLAGGVKGLSGLLSSPIVVIAGLGLVAVVVLK